MQFNNCFCNRQPHTRTLNGGPLVSRRTASVQERELNLTPTEFDVLLSLTNHPTNVVTTSTTLITNWEGRQLRKAEFLQILLSLRRKIAFNSGTSSYLDTETLSFVPL
jgi:DNA-binding response OmpR family regulator